MEIKHKKKTLDYEAYYHLLVERSPTANITPSSPTT